MVENQTTTQRKLDALDVAKIQVLVARYGDRVPRMLSAERPVEEQLEQIVREFGELHVTVNGKSYAEFADEMGLERRGDGELPHAAGRTGGPALQDPVQTLEQSRQTGAHHADNFQGNILPVADADPTGRLADEARRRKDESRLLDEALAKDEERKRADEERRLAQLADSNAAKVLAMQAGESTGSGGAAADQVKNAEAQQEVNDAELEQLAKDAAERGDTEQANRIRGFLALAPEERAARRPIRDADGSVRILDVGAGETIDTHSRDPHAPIVDQSSTAQVATRDPNELANRPKETTE